jgi:Holliday junction resolvasome RuvABC endonuclease subunit
MNHNTILAIDPGTREMGVAVLDNGALIYAGVKVIPKGRTPHETLARCRGVVLRCLRDFKPGTVVVEKTFIGKNRNAALLNVLSDEILALGKRGKLRVHSLAPNTVKKAIAGSGSAGKDEVARAVVRRFPELAAFLDQNRKWKARFHANMFDAVALALATLPRQHEETAHQPLHRT